MENPKPGADKSSVEKPSDATNSDTLRDLEENEKNDGSSSSDNDPGPAPDGQFDDTTEKDKAGPM